MEPDAPLHLPQHKGQSHQTLSPKKNLKKRGSQFVSYIHIKTSPVTPHSTNTSEPLATTPEKPLTDQETHLVTAVNKEQNANIPISNTTNTISEQETNPAIEAPGMGTPGNQVSKELSPAQIALTNVSTSRVDIVTKDIQQERFAQLETRRVPTTPLMPLTNNQQTFAQAHSPSWHPQEKKITQGKAATLILLFSILIIRVLTSGSTQFLGSQGWSYVLYGSGSSSSTTDIQNYLRSHSLTPSQGSKSTNTTASINKTIDQLVSKMTIDQKIGQMMMVESTGESLTLDMSTMLDQYHVGAFLLSNSNQNMSSQSQLKSLTQQLQQNSSGIPLIIATDQEGGTVNRLSNIYGERESASSIGATNDPQHAKAAGIQDATDLAAGGINMNLAPDVDVDNLDASMIHEEDRAFGSTAPAVTQMAGAYLQGLQQSHKVIGVIKHFPGLGDVAGNAHTDVTTATRSKAELESIDWAPYKSLIKQGDVDSIMVTHTIVPAIDTLPSSLSSKIIQGILRDEFKFNGVIITDSLTMQGITNLYSLGQASALAVEAGNDMLMGATDVSSLEVMISGIKQALNSGAITETQIDASVHRILYLKYQMGLLSSQK